MYLILVPPDGSVSNCADNSTLAGNEGGIFRVVPGFVAQWGIAGIPAVSAAWGNPIADDARVLSNVRGTIAYAAAMNAAGQAVNRTTQVRVRARAKENAVFESCIR